jgi:hypothetical protein
VGSGEHQRRRHTSGSPGSRIINYSVGAYDINNVIAPFSSRGAGQDGEIKPNIAAPGVAVRSSVPGNGRYRDRRSQRCPDRGRRRHHHRSVDLEVTTGANGSYYRPRRGAR